MARDSRYWAIAVFALLLLSALGGCVQRLAVLGDDDGTPRDAGADTRPLGDTSVDAGTDSGVTPSGIVPRQVTAGVRHTCAIFSGALHCWGANERGQLGLGDRANRDVPERVGVRDDWVQVVGGEFHSCGLTADTRVHCWGGNDRGQLGLGDGDDRLAPAAVDLPGAATYVDVGYLHSCAIVADRSISCWGDNEEGQLGLDDWVARPSPTRLESGVPFHRVALGQASSIASGEDGSLWGWGRNSSDHLGLGPGAPIQRQSPTFIRDGDFGIVAATQGTSGALASGTLWAWGDNSSAQIGDGTRENRATPAEVVTGADYLAYELGTFAGCAIDQRVGERGVLECWGRNVEGQLGLGDNDDRLQPAQAGAFEDWVEVSVGRFHTCARRLDGSVYCSGDNEAGQLGVGDTVRRNGMAAVESLLR